MKDGTLGGAGTSVLPGSLGHEAERSVGSDSSRPLGAYDGGCAGTWKGVNLWRVQKTLQELVAVLRSPWAGPGLPQL